MQSPRDIFVPSFWRAFFLAALLLAALLLLGGCSMLGLGESEPGAYDIETGLEAKQPAERPESQQSTDTTAAEQKPDSPRRVTATLPPDEPVIEHKHREPRRLEKPKPAATPQSRSLEQAISELLATSALHGGNGLFSVYVVNLMDDTAIFERSVHTSLVPASNMKLFTTAAALEFLGPDFRYETTVEALGPLSGATVMGDVVVRGSGDPTISARMHDWDPLRVFKQWAQQLKQKGVRSIQGDLVGDASLFERFVYCPGWDPEDEPIWYAAQTDALSLNENCIKVFVRPGRKTGSPVRVELEPDTSTVQLENTARTGSRRSGNTLRITRRCGSNVIEISGRLPSRYKERVRTLTIDDPATYFMDVLAQVFAAEGIAITGRVRVERKPLQLPRGAELLRRTSPPLSELIHETNTESNNFFAEQLLRTIGAHMRGRGTREGGAEVIMNWMHELGVPRGEFTMVDGSGLSRLNSISTHAVVTVLRHMHQGPYKTVYLNSLPVSGKDGTLRRRMRGTPAYSAVKAKTGYMKGVTSLGGYTSSLDGQPLAFSLIYNGRRPSTSYVKNLEDKLCILLRTHEAGITARPAPPAKQPQVSDTPAGDEKHPAKDQELAPAA